MIERSEEDWPMSGWLKEERGSSKSRSRWSAVIFLSLSLQNRKLWWDRECFRWHGEKGKREKGVTEGDRWRISMGQWYMMMELLEKREEKEKSSFCGQWSKGAKGASRIMAYLWYEIGEKGKSNRWPLTVYLNGCDDGAVTPITEWVINKEEGRWRGVVMG